MNTTTTPTSTSTAPVIGSRARWAWLLAALIVQALLVGFAVAPQGQARVAGQEVQLRVAPVDPIDPFRGAYVQLGYPDLPQPDQLNATALPDGGRVYVPLTRQGEIWRGEAPVRQRPASGPFLACHDQGWRLKCGIDSWFVPQSSAAGIERAVADGHAIAVVRVDGAGNAALVDLRTASD